MSLFGAKPALTAPGGSSGGLFGSAFGQQNQQNQQNQQPQPNQQAQQPQTSFGLFGKPQQQQPQQPAQPQQQPQANAAPAFSNNASTAQPSTFSSNGKPLTLPSEIISEKSSDRVLKDLLESAHNLPTTDHNNLGSIHLTLNELQERTAKLRKTDKNSGNFTKAHYLLSGSGVNAGDMEHDLSTILSKFGASDVVHPRAPPAAASSFDASSHPDNVENFLRSKKEENILSAIELSLEAASKDFDNFINQKITIDWKVRKDHLKKSLGIPTAKISAEALANSFSWNQSVPGNYRILSPLNGNNAAAGNVRHFTREKFESYARVVYQLNEARLQHKPFPLCLTFEELSKANTDLRSKQMTDVWKVLAELTNEKFSKISQEQLFFDPYQNDVDSLDFRKKLVLNSRSILEKQFFIYMDEIYSKDEKPEQFAVPNNLNRVSYFIHKIISKKNDAQFMNTTLNVNGVPIWALVYYLLRSGLYSEAYELVNSHKELFEKFDKNFPIYLSRFVNNGCIGLPSELQSKLSSDFNQTFRFLDDTSAQFDPYKYAVYKIIGKCDLAKKNLPAAINLSIEDWLWFHLSLLNEFNLDSSSSLIYENYKLENLQKRVLSIGATNFNASSNNPLYLRTLVMLGLYEMAVSYAYENTSECDAVHLAIALSYYGLLRVPSSSVDNLLVTNGKGQREINFSRLLGSYTRSFKISDPKVAIQYLLLVCLAKGGKSQDEIAKCHEALRELILVTREFSLLLGELNPQNGEKLQGILEDQRSLIELPNLEDFHREIAGVSASRCEEEGRTFDALQLYQLSQDYDTVVKMINKILSEVLTMLELDKSLLSKGDYKAASENQKSKNDFDGNIIVLSNQIMSMFRNNSRIMEQITESNKEVNAQLLSILDIREQFAAKDWSGSLALLEKLPFLSSFDTSDFVEIRTSAESLVNYDVALVRVVPSLLLMTITSVAQLVHGLKTKRFGDSASDKQEIARLKKVAKNCMVYAGMIQYRMPRETYSLLVSLESQL